MSIRPSVVQAVTALLLAADNQIPLAEAIPAAGVSIPLCAGLSVVTAIARPEGDYESIKTVTAVGADDVRIAYSAQVPNGSGGLRLFQVRRTVLRRDLADATLYMHYFHPRAPVTFAGSTALGTSSAVLRALKTSGAAMLQIVPDSSSASSANRSTHPNVYDFQQTYALRRVGAGPVTLTVVVNDAPQSLSVIRAQGDYLGDTAEFYFLDDERNPLALRYRFASDETEGGARDLEVVKISYHCRPSPERL
ncbi:MAG: hypothetical protein ABJC36_13915 [Gemmatimonadales bacterium]